MRDNSQSNQPFAALGDRLKTMRESRRKSLAEVSGAVEIDLDMLSSIEEGKQRPSEDILLLLINHLGIKEEEADRLWELAGYPTKQLLDGGTFLPDDSAAIKPMLMIMPMDARIVYTDMVQVTVNNYGVVMNFLQTAGPGNQPMAISRVGMSKEHARSVLEVLQQTLDQAEQPPKALAPPQKKADKRSSSKRSSSSDQNK